MLRRMATVVAATTALALAGAAPAFADHVAYSDPHVFDGNLTCTDFGLTAPPAATGWDSTGKVDPPVDVDNQFVTATLSDDGTELTVVAKDGFVITAVLVKGGTGGGGTAYFHAPFDNMTASATAQEISHYNICGELDGDETETPTPTPTDTETPTPTPTPTPTKDGETPKPVPTSVPAGYGQADNGSASTIGLLAFLTALAVGGAALVTRRFLKDN
jgi:hypothetical protein